MAHLEMDLNKKPLGNYAKTIQRDVTTHMRDILVDKLEEVVEEFNLASDTLYFAVSCIDNLRSIRLLHRNCHIAL